MDDLQRTDFQRIDHALFFAINNGLKSPLGDLFLGYSTYLGDGVALYPLSLLALFLLDKRRFWFNLAALAVAAILGGIILQSLKAYFNTPRPLALFDEALKRGEVVINVMFEPLRGRSFPSGHSQTAFTFAHIFSWIICRAQLPSARPSPSGLWLAHIGLYFAAALTALSRIYCGVHFPSDVLVGAFIGVFTAQLVIWAAEWREGRQTVQTTTT